MISLAQTAILLAAAVVAVSVFRFARLSSILGYLVAGLVIGPWGLNLIGDVGGILQVSEFGIVLLLFIIGLELQPTRLWVMRRIVFGYGPAQVALCSLLLGAGAWALGVPPIASAVIGFGLSLSSTPLVLQVLAERGQLKTQYGRGAFGILLFQDLAVLPALALLPMLAPSSSTHEASGSWWITLLKLLAVIVAVIGGGRLLLRPAARVRTPGGRRVRIRAVHARRARRAPRARYLGPPHTRRDALDDIGSPAADCARGDPEPLARSAAAALRRHRGARQPGHHRRLRARRTDRGTHPAREGDPLHRPRQQPDARRFRAPLRQQGLLRRCLAARAAARRGGRSRPDPGARDRRRGCLEAHCRTGARVLSAPQDLRPRAQSPARLRADGRGGDRDGPRYLRLEPRDRGVRAGRARRGPGHGARSRAQVPPAR